MRFKSASAVAGYFLISTIVPASLFAARKTPALLVVISVDQMRADYLDRFSADFKGGLARLTKEGAVFTEAHQIHVPTETCPGHAAILTGRTPHENGIVSNNWWDRDSGKTVYCVEDPVFGRSPLHLLTPTLGDALKAGSPTSEIASFSEKDRAAILLGGRKADIAVWYDSKSGDFVTTSYYGGLPSWVDKMNALHLINRHYGISDLTKTLNIGSSPAAAYEDVLRTPFSDQLLGQLVQRAVLELKLGRHSKPDLLAVSFSATDYIGHAYGPYSQQMKDNLISLDGVLGDLFSMLDQKIGKDNYAVALTADHGVVPTPESPEGQDQGVSRLSSVNFLKRVNDLLRRRYPSSSKEKWVLDFSPPHLYLNHSLIKKTGFDRSMFLSGVAAGLKTIPEVAEVFTPDQLDGFQVSNSTFAAMFAHGWFEPRAGDLLVRLKENILYSSDASGTGHGTPYDYDSHVPLIFWGQGIKAGKYDAQVSVTDLAPTAGKILGVDFPPSNESRVLNEILAD